MGRRLALALTLTAALSAGCGLNVSGLSAGAGGASVSASAGGEGGVVSTSSGSVTSSGTTAPCMGAEICNDGIDNDCNQATDCADDACNAGFVCIPAIPSEWRAVAFSEQGRPDCPVGYATADVVSEPPAASACVCTCDLQNPASCVEGMIVIEPTGSGQCMGAPSIPLDANGSSCGKVNLNTGVNTKVKISPLPATQGTCSANVAKAFLPAVEGRSCSAAAVGGGCADGGACVTILNAPFVSCIEHDGAATCPAGFPKGHSVGESVTGDNRDCSSCSCGTSATCSSPKLTLYTSSDCSFGGLDWPLTGACEPLNDGLGNNYDSFRYTATIANGMTCGKTVDTAPTGSLVLEGERTVCCQ